MANSNKWSGPNPWLGLVSYTEGTAIYGRDTETTVLADVIKNNLATIVFGKSGVGKSSLISAGISPVLREDLYIPVKMRLVHNTEVSYAEQMEDEVRRQVVCTDMLPASVPDLGLWDFFHRHNFTTADGEECTPVVILDQFEEIYTLTDEAHKSHIHAFFQELSSLLNDIKPDHVVEAERQHASTVTPAASVGTSKLTIKRVAASAFPYADAINFRFVICMREDKLYLLERNSANIPSIKTNRFNLQALSIDSAQEVIMQPRPDLFTNEEALSIIDKLADMGDEGVRTVDPAILSLFLYKYYEKRGTANADNIFADYYHEATKGISSKSIAFLEEHLLTLSGYRNQVPLTDVFSSGVTRDEVNALLINVILRTEKRKGMDYIEYSHDRLCKEARKNREERTMLEQTRKIRRRMFLSFCILAVSVSVLVVVLWQKYQLGEEKFGRISAEVAADSISRLNQENEQQLHLNKLQRDSIKNLNDSLTIQMQIITSQHDDLLEAFRKRESLVKSLQEQIAENTKQKETIEKQKHQLIYRLGACPACNGTGHRGSDVCDVCDGAGYNNRSEILRNNAVIQLKKIHRRNR